MTDIVTKEEDSARNRLKESVRNLLQVVKERPGDEISTLNAAIEMALADRDVMKFFRTKQGDSP